MQSQEKAENGFPLELNHCLEELVKFTLHSRLNNTCGFQLRNLSETFCATLLKDDPTDSYSDDADGLETIEAKCASDKYSRIESGNLLLINKCVVFEVQVAGLSYEGVQGLLGLMHIPGKNSIALPPPRSALLASFNMPYKPNVKSSALTHGARALAKHTYRSSNNFWGSLDGNDFNKNRLAVDVINRLIEHCSWLNVHFVAPHGFIFEIRIANGYGARWTEDGSKFIGFLEPYMQDGHSKGWMH